MMTWKRWIVSLSAALSLSMGAVSADTTLDTFSVKGVVTANTNVEVLNLTAGTYVAFPTISDTDFANGHVTNYANPIQLQGIRTNTPVVLKIKSNGWTTLPAGYDSTNGPKKTDGSDSEFLLQADVSSLTVASGNMTVMGSFGGNFVAITNTAQDMLKLGDIASGSGLKSGCQNASINFFPQMKLDGAYDIAGDYVIELELIITDQL